MKVHANAKLGLAGRGELVVAIERGMSLKQAAARFSVSPATAHRWWHRWLAGGRHDGALVDRSSCPHRQPRRLTAAQEEPIVRARRETNLDPRPVGGDRSAASLDSLEGAAPARPLTAAARCPAVVPSLRMVTALDPPEAVMTDNAFVYVHSKRFHTLLTNIGARHIRTPPYTPRWNGKAERFIQTLQNEWAYSRVWANSSSRARSLQSFIRYYNNRRPHSSLGDRPPISRVHNVRRQDI